MTRKASLIAIAAALVVFSLSISQAPAAGPVGGYESDTATGERSELAKAIKLIDLGSYASAVPLLKKVIATDPRNPDAFSLMGFSLRKLGDWDAALRNYNQALELDPKHLGANEYLGELYLEMSDLPRAEQRLNVLKTACGTECVEYLELQEAVTAFKAAH